MNPGNEAIKSLLDQARQAINGSNAEQALQCVVQAVKLLNGDSAVIPVLRSAAEQYHAQQTAPIDELSMLLSSISLQVAQQDQQVQQQQYLQQQQQAGALQQPAEVHQQLQSNIQPSAPMHSAYNLGHPQLLQEQQEWKQQQLVHSSNSSPILNETGRGAFTDLALKDGSSWQCPHCGGVVLQERRAAHLQHWCPHLGGNASPR